MSGADQKSGAALLMGGQLINRQLEDDVVFLTVLRQSGEAGGTEGRNSQPLFKKFPGSQPGDLSITEDFLKHLPGVPEERARDEYCKLPPLFQKALAFVYNTGWPEVDLEELFEGTSCPGGSLIAGAEKLALEGFRRIKSGIFKNMLKSRLDPEITRMIDNFALAEDFEEVILRLVSQMESDLQYSIGYLTTEEKESFNALICGLMEQQAADINGLVIQFYAGLRKKVFTARMRRKRTKPSSKDKCEAKERKTYSKAGNEGVAGRHKKRPGSKFAERGDSQESEAKMLRWARILWKEKFFRKMYALMGEEIVCLSHPQVLAKALYFLKPRQRILLGSLCWNKFAYAKELSRKCGVMPQTVVEARTREFRKLAARVVELRVYGEGLACSQAVPLDFSKARALAGKIALRKVMRAEEKIRAGEERAKARQARSWARELVRAAKIEAQEQRRLEAAKQILRRRIPSSLRPAAQNLPLDEDLVFQARGHMSQWLKKLRKKVSLADKPKRTKAKKFVWPVKLQKDLGWSDEFCAIAKSKEVLSVLSVERRKIIRLFYWQTLSHQQIADKLGLPKEHEMREKKRALEEMRVYANKQ